MENQVNVTEELINEENYDVVDTEQQDSNSGIGLLIAGGVAVAAAIAGCTVAIVKKIKKKKAEKIAAGDVELGYVDVTPVDTVEVERTEV